jgi:hypothetical protein
VVMSVGGVAVVGGVEGVVGSVLLVDDVGRLEFLLASGVVSARSVVGGRSLVEVAFDAGAWRCLELLVGVFRVSLHDFLFRDDVGVVRFALGLGVSAVGVDADGSSPLLVAVQRGFRLVPRFLVRLGVPVGGVNVFGDSVLGAAVVGGDVGLVRLLVGRGGLGEVSSEVLRVGVERGLVGVVRSLVGVCDVGWVDECGWSLLHFAARERSSVVAGVLLGAGADVDARNVAGSTPVHFAAGHHFGVLRLLVGAGGGVNVQNVSGDSPLHLAVLPPQLVWRGSGGGLVGGSALGLRAAGLLLRAGADPNLENVHGVTPSMRASFLGGRGVRLFRKFGGRVDG